MFFVFGPLSFVQASGDFFSDANLDRIYQQKVEKLSQNGGFLFRSGGNFGRLGFLGLLRFLGFLGLLGGLGCLFRLIGAAGGSGAIHLFFYAAVSQKFLLHRFMKSAQQFVALEYQGNRYVGDGCIVPCRDGFAIER